MKQPGSASDPLWYKDALIYELHVRAFADGNNDGVGDFPGLLQKLDYLQDLGVTCLWVLPFFPSPLRDDGYDISDYMNVHPHYGTLEDFRMFLAAAHDRGLQVMIELVMNHTSDQHPWFQAARNAPPGSDGAQLLRLERHRPEISRRPHYFYRYRKIQLDLGPGGEGLLLASLFLASAGPELRQPRVVEEVLRVMRFWLDMGVDALRMDAIPYLVERDGTNCENLPETHAMVKRVRAEIDEGYANRMVLAEANQWPSDVRPYFGDGDECHMAFHFPLMPRIYMALRQEDRLPITDIMAQTPEIPANCQWGLFLRNHDELTLEMVTTDERDYMYLAYSADPRMRINLGIRRRLAPLMDNNRRRIELLNSLLLSFPGTPIIYYGDEIGMGDNIYLGDRNGVRTPMQWNGDRNAGFSRADPAKLFSPVIMDPVWGYQAVNVEAQQSDPFVAPELDAQHDRAAQALSGLRTRHAASFWIQRTARSSRICADMRGNRCCASPTCRASRSPSTWISPNAKAWFRSRCSATSNSRPSAASHIVSRSARTDSCGSNCTALPNRRAFGKPRAPP